MLEMQLVSPPRVLQRKPHLPVGLSLSSEKQQQVGSYTSKSWLESYPFFITHACSHTCMVVDKEMADSDR